MVKNCTGTVKVSSEAAEKGPPVIFGCCNCTIGYGEVNCHGFCGAGERDPFIFCFQLSIVPLNPKRGNTVKNLFKERLSCRVHTTFKNVKKMK